MNELIKNNTVKYVNEVFNYIEENEEITFYTETEIFTVSTNSDIMLFSDYEELCKEWLNTGIHESDKDYRNFLDIEKMKYDKKTYYDYKKNIWFDVY